MKTIFGISVIGVAWLGLLAGMLVIGLQSDTLVDAFTLGGTFGHFESVNEIILTFVVPIFCVLALGGTAIGVILKFSEAEN